MNTLELSVNTLFYATRYAIARNTGAALAVVNDIAKSAKRLEECDRIQLLKEIKEALARNGIEQSNRHDWEKAIAHLESAAPIQGDGKTPEQIEPEALGMDVDSSRMSNIPDKNLRIGIEALINSFFEQKCTDDTKPYTHGSAIFFFDREHKLIPKRHTPTVSHRQESYGVEWDYFGALSALISERLPVYVTIINDSEFKDKPIGLVIMAETEKGGMWI